MSEVVFFGTFVVFIVGILLLDLGVFSKQAHTVPFKEAILWTSVWVSISLAFYVFLMFNGHLIHGIETPEQLQYLVEHHRHAIELDGATFAENISIYNLNLALEYITGYVIEYALSVDNVFVIILVFIAFGVEQRYYKKVLFWGILGAIVMRFLFIFLSAALIHQFSWILYLFGILLVYTGVRMFFSKDEDEKIDPENHKIVRLTSRIFKVHPRYEQGNFWVIKDGKRYITPLFITLIVIEFTDVIFAVDSIPAIFSVTNDPYIVFFSNIFAIIGLRSLFFLVMNVMNLFRFLKIGLSVLLTFIGFKLILHDILKEWGFSTIHSLYVVVAILAISILASIIFPGEKEKPDVLSGS
ncbi:MAG: TerC/Alx family metal homeostasis membrane protein [Bacteroidales bacterium]|nr:TerC/Alx family metal homeostasis membrane protein [Bacteroidales bacterium]